MNSLDRMVALAVRIAEREGLLYEDDRGSFDTANNQHSTVTANPSDICHSPAIPFSSEGGTVRDEEGEVF